MLAPGYLVRDRQHAPCPAALASPGVYDCATRAELESLIHRSLLMTSWQALASSPTHSLPWVRQEMPHGNSTTYMRGPTVGSSQQVAPSGFWADLDSLVQIRLRLALQSCSISTRAQYQVPTIESISNQPHGGSWTACAINICTATTP